MRTIELSNHPEELRRAAAARSRRRGWLTRLLGVFSPGVAQARSRADADRDGALRAGIQGEERVEAALAAALDDEWTLIRGYCNARGEIDQLLIGPSGVVAIEVKNRNATISVVGDEWHFEKLDRDGRRLDAGRIADRSGRSPSQQLNEPADALEAHLRSHGCGVSIARVVLLPHRRTRLATVRNPTVTLIATSADEVVRGVRSARGSLPRKLLADAEKLIVRDHRRHERGRGGRRR